MSDKCALCNELNNTRHVAYIGEHVFIVVNLRLLKPGHVLILPKKHRESFDQLTAAEAKEMFEVIEKCSKALKIVYGYYPIVAINPLTRRSEKHVHIHLVPSDYGLRDYIATYENLPHNEEAPSEIREIIKENIAKAMNEIE